MRAGHRREVWEIMGRKEHRVSRGRGMNRGQKRMSVGDHGGGGGGGGKEHSVSRGRGMNRGQNRMSVGDHGRGGGGKGT